MSLINQMLKDLESRRGSDGQSRPETLSRRHGSMLPWIVVGLLAIAVLALAARLWLVPTGLTAPGTASGKIVASNTGPATIDTEASVAKLETAVAANDAGSPGKDRTPEVSVAAALPKPDVTVASPQATSESPPAEPAASVSATNKAARESTGNPSILNETTETPEEPAQAEDEDVAEGSMSIAPTQLSPDEQARASIQRGFTAMQRRDYARATDEFSTGLAILPAEDDARMALYQALRRQGRVAEAEGVLENGMVEGRQPHRFAEILARNYAARGQVPMAVSLLGVAPPRVAADPDYYALWGALLQQQGDYEAALPLYESLVTLEPRNGSWLAGLGVAQQQTGKLEAALETYRAALAAGGLPSAVEDYVTGQVKALNPEEN